MSNQPRSRQLTITAVADAVAIHATGDEGLLWTCPRCGAHWTAEVE